MTKWDLGRAALCVMAAIGLSACHDPDAYTLSPDRLNKIISITPSATVLPADGIARITITAQLDPLTDADKRLVKFTTSGGTLIWGTQEGPTTTVPADDDGRAVVVLRSSSTPGPVQLDVAAGPLSRSITIQFVSVRREELFGVDVTPPTIPADGFSTMRITVALQRLGTVQQRAVKFEVSRGTLLATGVGAAREATVTADTNGVAVIDLQSDKTPGPVRLTVTALERTDDFEVSFSPVDPSRIITLSASPASVPADGATPIAVVARIAAGLPAGKRTVTFGTTVGLFLPGRRGETTIDADGSNTAQATLVSTTTGEARLTATVDGTTASAIVQFDVALPDKLFVSPAAAALRSGESTLVTVTLLRDVGEVSPRLQVAYSAQTSSGASIGQFSGITLSNLGVSSATFNVGSTTYIGPVTIRASVSGGGSGTASVQIVP